MSTTTRNAATKDGKSNSLNKRALSYFTDIEVYFQHRLLIEHNRKRSEHKLSLLKLNGILSILATNWAQLMCEQNKMFFCKDLTQAKYSNNYQATLILNKFLKKYDISNLRQSIYYQRYADIDMKANLKYFARKITDSWYTNHNCDHQQVVEQQQQQQENLGIIGDEDNNDELETRKYVPFMHVDNLSAGFGYYKCKRTGSLYVVSFYFFK